MPYLTPRQRREQGITASSNSSYITPRQRRTKQVSNELPSTPQYLPDTSNNAAAMKRARMANDSFAQGTDTGFTPTAEQKWYAEHPILDKLAHNPVSNLLNKASKFTDVVGSNIRKTSMGADLQNPDATTGNKTADTIASVVGNIMGYFVPTGGAGGTLAGEINRIGSGVVNKVLPKAPTIVKNMAEGVATTAPLSLYGSAVEGDTPGEAARRLAIDSALGAGVGAAATGIQAIAKLIRKPVAYQVTGINKPLQTGFKMTGNTTPNFVSTGKIYGKDIKILPDEGDGNVRYFIKDKAGNDVGVAMPKDKFNKLVSDVKPITEPIKPTTEVLKSKTPSIETPTESKGKPRQFIENSVLNSEIAPEELKQQFRNKMPTYEPISNEKTWAKAMQMVETDPEGSKNIFDGLTEVKNANDTALGEALITKAIKDGNISEANRLSVSLAEKLTTAGQAVQAAAIFKRLSPEGILMYAQRVVKRANAEIEKVAGKLGKKVSMTDSELQDLIDRITKAQQMPEGRMKDIEIARAMQIITNKIPPTIVDKTRALRNIALLGNPKTFVRNITGNVLMGVADNISNIVGTPLDMLMSLKTGKRTVALPSLGTQAKGFVKGGGRAISDSLGGLSFQELKGKSVKEKWNAIYEGMKNPINTDLVSEGKFETGRKLAFKNSALRILENAVNTSLAIGDKPFSQAYYDDVLRQLMKSNKVKVATDEMKAIARQVAEERTYQDMNTISSLMLGIKRLPKDIQEHPLLQRAVQVFVDSLLPYAKTPAAILKRGLEYSPVGIIEGLTKLGVGLKTGTLDMAKQREIIDRISRSIVGGGLITGGVIAAKKGIATGAPNKDKDVAAYEKAIGKSPYAIKSGNTYRTYDWAQPVSMPFGAGVQAVAAKKEGSNTLTSLGDAAASALNFYADQPMLQSIQRLVGSTTNTKAIGQRILEAGIEIPKQFIPTIAKQIAQMNDNRVKETYSPDSIQKNLINQSLAKLPGNNLPNKVDVFGNDVLQFQGKNNFFNTSINPGFTTTSNPTPVQQEIMRLFNSTGETTHFPQVAPQKFTWKNQNFTLTTDEYTRFQRTMGQQTMKAYDELMKSPDYQRLSDSEKVKKLNSILADVKEKAKYEVISGRGIAKSPEIMNIPTSLTMNKQTKELTFEQQNELANLIDKYKNQNIQTYSKLANYKFNQDGYNKLAEDAARKKAEQEMKAKLFK